MAWYNANFQYRKKITIPASEIPLAYTADICTGGTASASSVNGGDVAASAFDSNTGTWWTSSTSGPLPQWLKYDLGVGVTKTARKFQITPRVADTNAKLQDFKLQGSNNDSDWTDIHSVTSETWADDTPKNYTFTNTTAYRYYRLYITDTVGNTYAQVVEFKIYEVSSPALTDFDLDVFLDDTNFDFTKARSDGFDVVFTDVDETTLLDYERRVHDSVNEIAHYKVKAPEISSTTDIELWMYYGYASASDVSDPTNVYDSYFKAVLSLDQSGNGTAGEYLDSTANNHDGRGGNGTPTAVPTQVTGHLYKGQDFDGGDYISLPDSTDWDFGTSNLTFSFWVKFDSTSGNQCFLGRPDGGTYLYLAKEGGNIRFRDYSTGPDMSAGWSPSTGVWYRINVSRNGSAFNIYANDTVILTSTSSASFAVRGVPLEIGANSSISYFVNGIMDEVKISVGIDRGAVYRQVAYKSEDDDLITIGAEEENPFDLTFTVNEIVVVNDANEIAITFLLDEEVVANDTNEALQNNFFTVNEEVVVNENVSEILYSSESFQVDETVVVNDVNEIDITFQLDEDVVVNDETTALTPQGTATYGTKIISINPLVFVSYSSPAKITKVDVTVPASITWEAVEISGLDYAQNVVYNSTTGFLYVSGADGKVAKIELDDLSNQTIIDLSDADNADLIEINTLHHLTYASTDSSISEIYTIDERETAIIDTDLTYLQQNETIIDTQLNFTEAAIIDTDLTYLQTNTAIINTNLAWLKNTVTAVTPIALEDIHIYLDSVELTAGDLILTSGNIQHTIDEKSTTTFQLARHHDQPNTTLAGATSTITNNNTIQIYIKGVLEFSGTISQIDPVYDLTNELIQVTAIMEQPADNRQTVNIPLPGLTNEDRTLYHIITFSPSIQKQVMDTRVIIVNGNGKYWTGSAWSIYKTSVLTFATFTLADTYYNAVDEDEDLFWNGSPTITNYEENPAYYNGIITNLGDKIEQNIVRYTSFNDVTDEFIAGTLKLKQNWEYFWFARLENFVTGTEMISRRYIGTSPSAISNDTWQTHNLSYKRQRQYEDTVTPLGYYSLGSAPFQIFSGANGKLITKDKWSDENDGLYRHQDASYDYEDYIKQLAALEYQKITNINGQPSPKTSANITLTIDAYYFYALKLLTRINVSNTLTSNVFTATNGFPVAIKTINISFADMRVSLQTDNNKSNIEIKEIELQEPNIEDYQTEEEHVLNYSKFDVDSYTEVK